MCGRPTRRIVAPSHLRGGPRTHDGSPFDLPRTHLPRTHLPRTHLPQPHLPQPHLPQPHRIRPTGAQRRAAAGIWERAPIYDRENRCFAEDFADLRLAGYLDLAVPTELGGAGMNLAQICQQQRRLAYRAPSTALATNMHRYWTGLAADLVRLGDEACSWMLEEAASGEVFAAAHGEAGNDFPVMLSATRAERGEGGYTFHGHKMFGSLTRSGRAWDCTAWTPLTRGTQRSCTRFCRALARAFASCRPGTCSASAAHGRSLDGGIHGQALLAIAPARG